MLEFLVNRKGILFVVSAPSGGGKSTILKALRQQDPGLSYSISVTTRKARGDERDGIEYHFRTVEEFEALIAENAFVEYAKVHGNYYGTLKSEVDRRTENGADVLLDIDVQGSLNLKQQRPDTVMIFVLPPSIATLERRLRGRGLDDDDAIALRLQNARNEVRFARHYDYVLVNRELDDTIDGVRQIIAAERRRAHRLDIKDAFGEIEFLPREDAEAVL
ncbi:MAG: guanylate kinase [Candidatus Sumerlaeota bacterium]|nr:guanylate kinase [Candidatus Sumerlaeota bacterium]